jgi:hypothetical protein
MSRQPAHLLMLFSLFFADSQLIRAAISFDAAPPEVLIAGGALVLSTAGLLIFEAIKASKQLQQQTPEVIEKVAKAAPLPREDAVLVFGASGRLGRLVVADVSARVF